MRQRLSHHSRGSLLTSLLLAVLLFRAYIPVGFMPAGGTPFLLELCPAASSPMPAHHHHEGGHGHFEHCPFGSAPPSGPVSQLIVFNPPAPVVSHRVAAFDSVLGNIRAPSAHQPRGPPAPV
jgi:hypothetical protein